MINLFKRIKENFINLNRREKINAVTVLALTVLVFVGVASVGMRQIITKQARGTDQINLKFNPGFGPVTPGIPQDYEIRLHNTSSSPLTVSGEQIRINVDNNFIINSVNCVYASAFTRGLEYKEINGQEVIIMCTTNAPGIATPPLNANEERVFANINLTVKPTVTSGTVSLNFVETRVTQHGAAGSNSANDLSTAGQNASYLVAVPTATPTISPTPTPTPVDLIFVNPSSMIAQNIGGTLTCNYEVHWNVYPPHPQSFFNITRQTGSGTEGLYCSNAACQQDPIPATVTLIGGATQIQEVWRIRDSQNPDIIIAGPSTFTCNTPGVEPTNIPTPTPITFTDRIDATIAGPPVIDPAQGGSGTYTVTADGNGVNLSNIQIWRRDAATGGNPAQIGTSIQCSGTTCTGSKTWQTSVTGNFLLYPLVTNANGIQCAGNIRQCVPNTNNILTQYVVKAGNNLWARTYDSTGFRNWEQRDFNGVFGGPSSATLTDFSGFIQPNGEIKQYAVLSGTLAVRETTNGINWGPWEDRTNAVAGTGGGALVGFSSELERGGVGIQQFAVKADGSLWTRNAPDGTSWGSWSERDHNGVFGSTPGTLTSFSSFVQDNNEVKQYTVLSGDLYVRETTGGGSAWGGWTGPNNAHNTGGGTGGGTLFGFSGYPAGQCNLSNQPTTFNSCGNNDLLRVTVNAANEPTATPTPTPPASCALKSIGDANCDGAVNGIDYGIFVGGQCAKTSPEQVCNDLRPDFDLDTDVDEIDLTILTAHLN